MAQRDALTASTRNGQQQPPPQQQAVQFMYPAPVGFPQQPLGAATPALHVLVTASSYVYVLHDNSGRTYVGCTQDLHLRVAQHNGLSSLP